MGLSVGISAFYHDSAAALVADGQLVAAAQQERFSRVKHDAMFPRDALRYCLSAAGVALSDVDTIVFYEDPVLKRDRIIDTLGRNHPHRQMWLHEISATWLARPNMIEERLVAGLTGIDSAFDAKRLRFTSHHRSHAASAFFPSPFRRAGVLTVDGTGEWATTAIHIGEGDQLQLVEEIFFPDSIGLLYAAFTAYLGFKVNDGEYKVMGLAPYGEPRFADLIREKLIATRSDASFSVDQSYFDYYAGTRMFNEHFVALFGHPARMSTEPLVPFHMDVAASIQSVTNDMLLELAARAVHVTRSRNLCLAGGVALNCVTNGVLLRSGIVDELWIQPAAGDAGGAVGAAFIGAAEIDGRLARTWRAADGMSGAYLGPDFSDAEIERYLASVGATYRLLDDDEIIGETVAHLVAGNVVGWFQGRMEFGPRALGNRSILADARSPTMQVTLNEKTKARESFRPFAPAVRREDCANWFDLDVESPYMLLVADVRDARRATMNGAPQDISRLQKVISDIPAVTHVDCSARVQTVSPDTNPRFHRLIGAFAQETSVPVLVNTSFNVSDEPIVCTPDDAFRCFLGTKIDVLVMGRCLLLRHEQRVQLPPLLHLPASRAFSYAEGYCVQWYGFGVAHVLNNRLAAQILPNPTYHRPMPVVLHERIDAWFDCLRIAAQDAVTIFAVGGSTTAFDVNWPSFIAEELRAAGCSKPVIVVNLGQPEFSTFDQYFLVREFLATATQHGLKPDLIVSLDGANDIGYRIVAIINAALDLEPGAPNEARLLDGRAYPRRYDRLPLPNDLLEQLKSKPERAPVDELPLVNFPAEIRENLVGCFAETLGAFRELAAEAGVPCVDVLQPMLKPRERPRRETHLRAKYAAEFDEFRARLREAGTSIEDRYAFDVFRRQRWLRMSLEEGGAVNIEPSRRCGCLIDWSPLQLNARDFWAHQSAQDPGSFLDLLNLLETSDADPYLDDGVHYTLDGARRIAAAIAGFVMARHASIFADDSVPGDIRTIREAAWTERDNAVRQLLARAATERRGAIEIELARLLALGGNLELARSFAREPELPAIATSGDGEARIIRLAEQLANANDEKLRRTQAGHSRWQSAPEPGAAALLAEMERLARQAAPTATGPIGEVSETVYTFY